jgi:hypothetical protein
MISETLRKAAARWGRGLWLKTQSGGGITAGIPVVGIPRSFRLAVPLHTAVTAAKSLESRGCVKVAGCLARPPSLALYPAIPGLMDFEARSQYLDRIFDAKTLGQLSSIMDELKELVARNPRTRHVHFLIGACGMQTDIISPDRDSESASASS